MGSRTWVHPSGQTPHGWVEWESARCVDWREWGNKVQSAIRMFDGLTPYIVVEGFLLLEDEATRQLLDHVLCINIHKETAWQRRLKRCLQKDASGQENYDVLPT